MNIKNFKFLKIVLMVFCVLFVFTIISSSIISADIIHTKHCCEDHCITCQMIQTASLFSKNISYIIKYIVLIMTTMPLIFIIRTEMNNKLKESLVSLNVILNE